MRKGIARSQLSPATHVRDHVAAARHLTKAPRGRTGVKEMAQPTPGVRRATSQTKQLGSDPRRRSLKQRRTTPGGRRAKQLGKDPRRSLKQRRQ